MRIATLLPSTLLALLLAACAAPVSDAAPAPGPTPAPQVSGVARIGADSPDFSCKVAGDCAVKNVGNCCGYFPACVNKDSPVDPDAVRAECARTGMSSVCGWRDIQACDCVQGRCQPAAGPLEADR
ncbi:hypothetical protein FQY83_07880 [Luteimonas marina]|uniref:Secreted protein n=1 Tax=Luteimonas marina TaxID=488485 RepID=A0A5C5U5F7_9GAMM|nr:hypothetical protein [Luteimonas marina]TWT21267.1 hypothetical protein FQY83_07880 [Luteimonas marina]